MKNLLIIVIFLTITISTYSQSCVNKRLLQIIEKQIEKSNANFNKKHGVISLLFYKIGNNEYFYVQSTPFFNPLTFKGYCYYKDYIIIYEGLNDSVANKFINLNSFFKTTENIDSLKWNNSVFDPFDSPSYYKISTCKFLRFTPNKNHIKLLEKELIRVGYILTPPPLE